MDIRSVLYDNVLSKLWKRFVYVREIRDPESLDAKQFVELYDRIIPATLRISPDIILDFVSNDEDSDITHHLYVCKRNDRVIGFIKFMICERLQYLFIAYLGIDSSDIYAKAKGVKMFLKKCIMKYTKKKNLNIIIEISQYSKDLSIRRLVRIYSKMFHRISYTVDADYLQPAMPDTNCHGSQEEALVLIYIPFHRLTNNIIKKEELCAIISSIYFDIYAPSCSILDGCNSQQYNNYLSEILDSLTESYKKIITLNPC